MGWAFSGPRSTYLKAARYSGSPIGGSRPPAQATLMLKPSPLPAPTWRTGCRRDMRVESQERNPRMLVLREQLTHPLHFQMEKLRTREAKQSAQDHTASWNRVMRES